MLFSCPPRRTARPFPIVRLYNIYANILTESNFMSGVENSLFRSNGIMSYGKAHATPVQFTHARILSFVLVSLEYRFSENEGG